MGQNGFLRMVRRAPKTTAIIAVVSLLVGFCAGQAYAQTLKYTLGDTVVSVTVSGRGGGYTYVSVHDNENTSVSAAKAVMASSGGTLIELKHGGSRNLAFTLNGVRYAVDPNRIFTPKGRAATFRTLGKYSVQAESEVAAFASWFISIVQQHKGRAIVALHNNSGGGYTFTNYQKGADKKQASLVSKGIVSGYDHTDFFFTTSASIFKKLKAKGMNVALQSGGATDDGSLSVYFARGGTAYVNIEARHGHLQQQINMLKALQ
jgi:hypothetical protein